MKIVYEYSHLGAKEILQVNHNHILKEIHKTIASVCNVEKTKISKEKTMTGRLLYNPSEMNKMLKNEFNKRNFFEIKDKYDIKIANYDKIIKNSFKQIDFVKEKFLLRYNLVNMPLCFMI